jgi:hypothetical protein
MWWEHHRLLELGSGGKDVRDLQETLNRWFPTKLRLTGVFDHATEERVKEFQKLNDLVEDGKVGPITHCVLFESHYEYSIAHPPVILQSQFLCWAAALESALKFSWLGRPKLTIDQLRSKYNQFLLPMGDITLNGFEQVLKDLRASGRFFKGADLRIEKILAFLREHKVQILLVDDLMGGNVAHTRVIYGVKMNAGNPELLVMDPLQGYISLNFTVLQGVGKNIILAAPVMRLVLDREL